MLAKIIPLQSQSVTVPHAGTDDYQRAMKLRYTSAQELAYSLVYAKECDLERIDWVDRWVTIEWRIMQKIRQRDSTPNRPDWNILAEVDVKAPTDLQYRRLLRIRELLPYLCPPYVYETR